MGQINKTTAEINAALLKLDYVSFNEFGGQMIKLINKTGSSSVKGQIVAASTDYDGSFMTSPANGDMPIGIVYDAGIADGQSVWIVVSGVAEVLSKDGQAPVRGYLAYNSDVAGRADYSSSVPATSQHNREIGHVLESKSSGTNVLAKIVLHFN